MRTRFVDFEPLGRQRAELVDGQSAVSLLRRLVEHVADAGTYPGGRRLLDAQLHGDRVGELEPDPADGPREPVGFPLMTSTASLPQASTLSITSASTLAQSGSGSTMSLMKLAVRPSGGWKS